MTIDHATGNGLPTEPAGMPMEIERKFLVASDEWRKLAHELTPEPFFAMWRPRAENATGHQGELRLPWALGTEK